jgi:hypothetical protein
MGVARAAAAAAAAAGQVREAAQGRCLDPLPGVVGQEEQPLDISPDLER